jgi:tetratricopeptide (TPR) repeat protein
MRSQFIRVLVLIAGLGLTAAGCGKYSINNLRATQAFQTGNEMYRKGEWKTAVSEYSRAVELNPDLGYAYFFLGNSYDNLYKPTKKGEPENDANIQKAVDNYKLAIEKLKGNNEPQAPKILKLSFEYLIAAYGTEKINDLEKAVPIAQELIAAEPNEPTNYQALGKLYEENGRYDEAEAMFKKAIEVKSTDPLGYEVLAGYYNRQGEFDMQMESLEKRAAMEPNNPEAWHAMGSYYSEHALKNSRLSKEQAKKYVMRGLEVEEVALKNNPEYFEALSFKNILLRQQANYEKDPALQKRLIDEANVIKSKAEDIRKKQQAEAAASNAATAAKKK